MSQAVLLLNATYEPMEFIDLEEAVAHLFAGSAEPVLDELGKFNPVAIFHSVKDQIVVPATLKMRYYVKNARRKKVVMTKKNVLVRDDYLCGYCGRKSDRKMTVDHVIPRSYFKARDGKPARVSGSPNTWENLVACCQECNGRKRDRTPEEAGMKLLHKPFRPKRLPWDRIKRNTWADEWDKYFTLYEVDL